MNVVERTLEDEMNILGQGEFSRYYYYPNTRNAVKQSYKSTMENKYPEERHYSISRVGKRHDEFIPFVNERDQMGRLILPTKDDLRATPSPSVNETDMKSLFPSHQSVNVNYLSSSFSKKRNSRHSILGKEGDSISNSKDFRLSPSPSPSNANIRPSRLSRQLNILPSLLNESQDVEKGRNMEFANKLKFNEPIQEFHGIASRRLSGLLSPGPHVSSCFLSPSRSDLSKLSMEKNKNSPSVGQYNPADVLQKQRTRNISFGNLPKFQESNTIKFHHEYDLDFPQSFDKLHGKTTLVPSFARQSERITGFDASPSKNPDKNTTVLAQLEKLEKYKALKRESSTKEMKELEQRRNLSLYLNEKNDPLDSNDVEDRVKTLKSKYNLRSVFKMR